MSGPIRQAAWRLILPEIRKIVREEIADQLGGFRGEVQGEFRGAEGEFKAVHTEIRRLDEKIESVRNELVAKIDGLEKRMDLAQVVLQHKVSELEGKLQKVT